MPIAEDLSSCGFPKGEVCPLGHSDQEGRYDDPGCDLYLRCICAAFNLIDRVADALGFEIPASFTKGAASQLKRGYRM